MTAPCKMLEIMKDKQRTGISTQEMNTHLRRIGVVDKQGQITPKYSNVISEKK